MYAVSIALSVSQSSSNHARMSHPTRLANAPPASTKATIARIRRPDGPSRRPAPPRRSQRTPWPILSRSDDGVVSPPLASILTFVEQHDQWALLVMFALLTLESFGLPLPGETALIACAVLASQGKLSIAWVIAVGVLAAIVGDNLGYW